MKIAVTDLDEARMQRFFAQFTPKDPEPVAVVYTKEEVAEKAFQTAQAYWMMGWAWDEIEAVLIDQEFEESVVQTAIKRTQEYATDTLAGPFKNVLPGQFIKTTAGQTARFVRAHQDVALVSAGEDTYQVPLSLIDLPATNELRRAFAYRQAAQETLHLAEEYKIPEGDISVPEVTPAIEETYKRVDREKGAPAGWAEVAPEAGEVESVNRLTSKIINNLDGLKAMQEELRQQMAAIKEQLKPIMDQMRELSAEEQSELRNLFLAIGSMGQEMDAIEQYVFGDYEGQIAGFKRAIVEQQISPDAVQELEALKQILVTNHPRIAQGVMQALQQFKDSNTIIERQVEHTFAKFPYRLKPRKGFSFTKWLSGIWDKIKVTTKKLYDKVFPAAETATDALREFNQKYTKKASAERVRLACKHYGVK